MLEESYLDLFEHISTAAVCAKTEILDHRKLCIAADIVVHVGPWIHSKETVTFIDEGYFRL